MKRFRGRAIAVVLVVACGAGGGCATPAGDAPQSGDGDGSSGDGDASGDGDGSGDGDALAASGGIVTSSGGTSGDGDDAAGGSSATGAMSSTGASSSTGGASSGGSSSGGTPSSGLCDVFDSTSAWDLCGETETSCSVVFEDSAGCQAVCAAAGLECAEVWENVEGQCRADTGRAELSCASPSNHESDFCVCGQPTGTGGMGMGGMGTGGVQDPGDVDCSLFESTAGWDLCSATDTACHVVFDDSSGCADVCEAAGLVCAEVWENVEDECAADTERSQLDCGVPSEHESDYCVCVGELGMGGASNL